MNTDNAVGMPHSQMLQVKRALELTGVVKVFLFTSKNEAVSEEWKCIAWCRVSKDFWYYLAIKPKEIKSEDVAVSQSDVVG